MKIFKKITLYLVTIFVTFILLEFTVRCLRPGIYPLGIDNTFFVKDTFGHDTFGFKAILNGNIFGKTFKTDSLGFRTHAHNSTLDAKDNKCTILMIGDSLSFGPGVDAEKIFPFLVERKIKYCNIINSSVIGYGITDYRQLLEYLLTRFHIDTIIVNICLNDFSPTSQNLIRKFLNDNEMKFKIDLNAFLRRNSRLYLFLRNSFLDVSKLLFEAETKLYTLPEAPKNISENIRHLKELAEHNNKKIVFFLFPYEFQLRSNNALPQDIIKKSAQENNVLLIDLCPFLRDALFQERIESKALYLTGDPMHFSEKGHKIIAEAMSSVLIDNCSNLNCSLKN